jgi:hypothetical protein
MANDETDQQSMVVEDDQEIVSVDRRTLDVNINDGSNNIDIDVDVRTNG